MGNELTTKLKRTVLIQMFNSIHHKNFIFLKRYKAYIKVYHLISFGCKDESENNLKLIFLGDIHLTYFLFHISSNNCIFPFYL